MKNVKRILITLIVIAAIMIALNLRWLTRLNGEVVYPADTFLDTVSNKTALIIVAHDDDAIACGGTVTGLVKKGWNVHFITFYGNYRKEDNPARKKEVASVASIQKLSSTELIDFSIQRSDTVKEPWRPIPYSSFADYMKVDSMKVLIAASIEKHRPSVIFSLDNIIGGYGHPEHACLSQCIIDVASKNKDNGVYYPAKIYQVVFTRQMNEKVLKNNPAYIAAKEVYKVEGSPEPTVEINIKDNTSEKKQIMLAFESQKRNLKKIWPYYNLYPHWLYFRIFDKEYFRVVDI